jgi:CarD family transcriptional regulator
METSISVGLRRISSTEIIKTAMKILSEPVDICCDNNSANWNKRNKEYQFKLRSGDICEICKIYRDLKYIASKKELSFGEKDLLHKTEALLAEEISLVKNEGEEKTIQCLRSMFA